MKKIITICGILGIIFIFPFFVALTSNNFNTTHDPATIDQTTLKTSLTRPLDEDDYHVESGYADNYIRISYNTYNPSVKIGVDILSSLKYSQWKSGFKVTADYSIEASSSTETWYVPTGDTWYVVYWNNVLFFAEDTWLSCTTTFNGDSRPPSITVHSPNSYSEYEKNLSQTITWSSIGSVGNVKIELFKGTSLHTLITSSTSDDGEYSWIIPSDCPTDTDYRIKISETTSSSVYDYSAYFIIRDPIFIDVLTPITGDLIAQGMNVNITWKTYGLTSTTVYIDLCTIGTTSYDNIVPNTQNDGWYIWGITTDQYTGNNDTEYQIRVRIGSIYGYSQPFNMVAHRTIEIINFNATKTYETNTTIVLEWETDAFCDTVIIEFRKSNGFSSNPTQILVLYSIPNIGEYNFTIPANLSYSEYYFVLRAGDYSCYDYGEYFTIGIPPPSPSSIPGYDILFFLTIALAASAFLIRKWHRSNS